MVAAAKLFCRLAMRAMKEHFAAVEGNNYLNNLASLIPQLDMFILLWNNEGSSYHFAKSFYDPKKARAWAVRSDYDRERHKVALFGARNFLWRTRKQSKIGSY